MNLELKSHKLAGNIKTSFQTNFGISLLYIGANAYACKSLLKCIYITNHSNGRFRFLLDICRNCLYLTIQISKYVRKGLVGWTVSVYSDCNL